MEHTPAYAQVRREFVAALYTIAHTLDLQIRHGAGAATLGLPENQEWPTLDEFNLDSLDFESPLEVIYRYAFYAEVGDSRIDDDWEEGNLGRLRVIADMACDSHFESNEDDVWEMWGNDQTSTGAFRHMVRLALARSHVDNDTEVSIQDLVVLGDMEERSVRNSLKAEGIVIEKTILGERVRKHDILSWLRSRRKYIETKRIGSMGRIPEQLEPHEITAFINMRALEYLKLWGMEHFVHALESKEKTIDRSIALGNLGRSVGWTEDQVEALLNASSVNDISPEDCPAIARMLDIDGQWWTNQFMRARFPEAMKELSPSIAPAFAGPSPFNEQENTLDAVLTVAGIRNGYFDIERRYADRFFPADSFGTKGAERFGKEVLFHHDQKNSPYSTDIRIKSNALASLRKRFSAYFTAHSAKPGDVIRIRRLGEREYELIFVPK